MIEILKLLNHKNWQLFDLAIAPNHLINCCEKFKFHSDGNYWEWDDMRIYVLDPDSTEVDLLKTVFDNFNFNCLERKGFLDYLADHPDFDLEKGFEAIVEGIFRAKANKK